MARSSFQRLDELFNQAVALNAGEREAFLDQACADDPELRAALDVLLRHDREAGTGDVTLKSPVDGEARRLRHDAPTLPAAPPTPAPRRLPHVPGYELLAELGRGGMGVVYKARQASLNRVVALKMLLPVAVPTAEQLARFRTEAEALARLSHPNVVPIYDVGECDGRPFYSMEFVPGPSLAAFLDGRAQEPFAAARLIETLARAVDAVHQQGIVHRDLKPANVLLAPRRDLPRQSAAEANGRASLSTYEPKITDFGLAKARNSGRALTLSGTTLGTPSYMAPEQVRGGGDPVGPATDVYALGSILYEMLTGRPPFDGTAPEATIARLVTDDPEPPSRLRPGIPRDLVTVCMKCLEKSPRLRYPTARSLAEDLRRFRSYEPIRARPLGAFGRFNRWCRRRPSVAALAALCAALAVAFVVTVVIYQFRLSAALAAAQRRAEDERQEIVDLHVTIGINEMENGDNFSAVLHFSEALRQDAGHPDRERNHRTRIATALRQSPSLANLFVAGRELLCVRLEGTGGEVATVGPDRVVEIRDVKTGRLTAPPLAREGDVAGGAFAADGRSLATFDRDGVARVWDLSEGTSRVVFQKAGADIRQVAFQPDGRCLLVLDSKSGVNLCELAAPKQPSPRQLLGSALPGGMLSEDNRRLFSPGLASFGQVWDVATRSAVGRPIPLARGGFAAALSPNGRRVAIVDPDNTVRVTDADAGWCVGSLPRPAFPVSKVAISPDGERVFTAGRGLPALVWKATAAERLVALAPGDLEISYARFSPDSRLLLTGDGPRGARVWDATSGRPLTPPLRHGGQLLATAFSGDGRWLAAAARSGVVSLWVLQELPEAIPPGTPGVEPAEPRGAAPEGWGRLLTLAGGARVHAVQRLAGGPLSQARPAEGASGQAVLSPDGSRVAAFAADGSVRLWDAASGAPVTAALRQLGHATYAAFSPDGTRLVTADEDHSARVWDARTGEALAPALRLPRPITRVCFQDKGNWVVVGCADGPDRAWDLTPDPRPADEIVAQAEVLACGQIDEDQHRQFFDPEQLRLAWQRVHGGD